MIFRSVVGKLWVTIIVLVSAIFLFLSIFLIEYFDHYYYIEQSDNLARLGYKVTDILDEYENDEIAISTIEEVVNTLEANMVIAYFDKRGNLYAHDSVFASEELNEIYRHHQKVVRLNDQTYKDYITFNSSRDKLALATPVYKDGEAASVIILYQSLANLYKTTNDIKKIILLFAGIGILLTTIFTFFLSSRITQPIREMTKAATEMAEGDFHSKVKIVTNDEIGDLAMNFNRMASQLDESVQALSNEKNKLESILESMADGVVTLNSQGKIMTTNPPAKKIIETMELPEENIVPQSISDMLNSVTLNKKSMDQDVKIDGRSFAVKMAPLYIGKKINGAVTVFRDVTYERKLDKLRKDFLANVSHELRTPISMLQGYSEAIIDDIAQSPEEIKELAQIINDESLRVGRLVNDLLDLAKLESGNFQLQFCKGDTYTLLNKMLRKFSTLANEHQISLEKDIDSILPEVFFDVDRMEQVLTNLIDNAIRHTPKNGTITLRAKRIEEDKILLEVQDSGTGIPNEDLPFVFDRFYKADKARTRGQSGTGLGLSIAKNIVNAHGGNISVSSKIGQGTTFSIVIPTNNLS